MALNEDLLRTNITRYGEGESECVGCGNEYSRREKEWLGEDSIMATILLSCH